MQQAPAPEDEILVYYRKENLFIYPSKNERISGRLSILQERGIVYLEFETYTPNGQPDSYPGMVNNKLAYSFKVELAKLRSLKRYIPPFGIGHVTVLLENGVAYPPFYFVQGGVHEFLTSVKDRLPGLNRAPSDFDLFRIDEQSIKMSQSMETLLPESKDRRPVQPIKTKTVADRLNEASWSLLEGFARVANFSLSSSVSKTAATTIAPTANPSTTASIDGAAEAGFELINDPSANLKVASPEAVPLPPSPAVAPSLPRGPVTAALWRCQFAADGSCSAENEKMLRSRIFTDGMEPALRKEAWKYLLGYAPFGITTETRAKHMAEKRHEYEAYKAQWQSITAEQLTHFAKMRDRQSRIERDVIRTDRNTEFFEGDENPNLKRLSDILVTYATFNWDIGYVQGMNDLLVPILIMMGDEVDAFWCFKGLMDRCMGNFHKDQVAMTSQLASIAHILKYLDPILHRSLEETDSLNMFFCFRWVLLQFKREFSPEDICKVWDAFWARSETDHFHLFFAVAVIESMRDKIISERMKFDELLKHVNELSCKMPASALLPKAMLYYGRFMDGAPAELRANLSVKHN